MSGGAVIELRRARPLLGTLVEITATGDSQAGIMSAIDAGFGAIGRIEALMSFHDRHSQLSHLNRLAHRTALRVHRCTWDVLRCAQRISRATDGLFDISIGHELVRMGYLPRLPGARRNIQGSFRDVELLSGHRVRFRRPLCIDLGGIAKGYAVDCAVAHLRASGVVNGIVNAGGDLRVFGPLSQRVHLRDPANPGLLIPFADVTNGALATSAAYFARAKWHGQTVTPLIHGRRRGCADTAFSVSVAAPTCMLADALTKVALLKGPSALGIVRRLGGAMFILGPQGVPRDSLAVVDPQAQLRLPSISA
jgi:thiamine biosynthesis lipoprotein